MQLRATNGTCWTAEFRAEGAQKNTGSVVSLKASTVGSPGGAFLR